VICQPCPLSESPHLHFPYTFHAQDPLDSSSLGRCQVVAMPDGHDLAAPHYLDQSRFLTHPHTRLPALSSAFPFSRQTALRASIYPLSRLLTARIPAHHAHMAASHV